MSHLIQHRACTSTGSTRSASDDTTKALASCPGTFSRRTANLIRQFISFPRRSQRDACVHWQSKHFDLKACYRSARLEFQLFSFPFSVSQILCCASPHAAFYRDISLSRTNKIIKSCLSQIGFVLGRLGSFPLLEF